jgi:hypothetical protein
MQQSTFADYESDASTAPQPEWDHDSNCPVCGGTGWHGDVRCFVGEHLPTDTEDNR